MMQIFVLLYKEVSIALKINSSYSKRKLLSIHENIKVLRYPNRFPTGIYLWYATVVLLNRHFYGPYINIFYLHITVWNIKFVVFRSHHEKLVIVDHHLCFLGGLDLCFGRYDTSEHQVSDFPPLLWPGKDYYNPRWILRPHRSDNHHSFLIIGRHVNYLTFTSLHSLISLFLFFKFLLYRESEPNSWEDSMREELDRGKYPRMAWHDVHCALWGPPCRDIARHFVQRWNHAKVWVCAYILFMLQVAVSYVNENFMQRNTPPDEQQIPLLMPQQHMVLPHYMGRSKEMEIEKNVVTINENHFGRQDSFSSQSPLEDIPLLLPHEASDHDASTTNEKINGLDSDECQLNQTPGMPLNLLSNLKSRNVILWPQVEAFQRTLDFTYFPI